MQLYQHQQKVLELNKEKYLLAMDTGTGKSLTAIELAKKNNCKRVLLICPKALKEKWNRDLIRYEVKGSPLVLSKEEFSRKWTEVPEPDCVIVDEAHFFSGMTSAMYKNLLKFLKKHNVKFIWLLTATPYLSTPWNIYALANLLGNSWSYMRFKDMFFENSYITTGKVGDDGKRELRAIPKIKKGIEGEIARLVNKIGFTIKIDECVDVPDQVYEIEQFPLTKDQKDLIKKVKLEDINPIVVFTKIHQVENGTLKGNEYVEDVTVDSLKNERILDFIQTNKKVAIVCRYNLQVKQLKNLIEKEYPNKKVFTITGEVKNRDEIVQEVERLDECVVIINASCSEGYELPSIGLILFASMSFSYKDYKQICGRFLRINKLKKNVFIHLVTTNGDDKSVDEAVYESIMNKQDFHMEIFAEEYKNNENKTI